MASRSARSSIDSSEYASPSTSDDDATVSLANMGFNNDGSAATDTSMSQPMVQTRHHAVSHATPSGTSTRPDVSNYALPDLSDDTDAPSDLKTASACSFSTTDPTAQVLEGAQKPSGVSAAKQSTCQ